MTVYLYDTMGTPIGMQYHKATDDENTWEIYWFEKNLQGDIVAVYNQAGTKLVSYKYDAWGNTTTSYHNSGASTKAADNPFTYRGYYYDTDLEMYYLGSRYYDSVVKRFINADKFVSTGQKTTGFNMFAYCNNNPVNFIDSSGEFPWVIITILVLSTAIGGYLGSKSDVKISHENSKKDEFESKKSITQDSDEELTLQDRIENTIVGAGMGLAVGGAVIAASAVGYGAVFGINASFAGGTALQGFALGALALNFTAFAIFPIFSIEIEPIEYETPYFFAQDY